MDCIESHWNRRSASYNEFVVKGFADRRERRAWQDHFSSLLGDNPLNILDVGCGPGIVSMQLAELGHKVTSVDLSDEMLSCARKNAKDAGLDIDFHKGNAMSLDFPDEGFDAVVSGYMLWTVPDPRKVISEWSRVLRKDGTLVYTDGDWFNDARSTPLRCRISDCFLGICRDSEPDEGDHDEFEETTLWSRTANRPSDDIGMLESAGFRDISVIHDVQKRVLHGARYYAYGFTNDHFTITARK